MKVCDVTNSRCTSAIVLFTTEALDRIRQIINNHFEKKSMYQSQALAQIASLAQRVQASDVGSPPIPVAQAFEPGIPLIPTTKVLPMPPSQPALPCGVRIFSNTCVENWGSGIMMFCFIELCPRKAVHRTGRIAGSV